MTPRFKVFANSERVTGGIATFVDLWWCGETAECQYKEFIPGKVSRLFIGGPDASLVFWDIHNYRLARGALVAVARQLQVDQKWARDVLKN